MRGKKDLPLSSLYCLLDISIAAQTVAFFRKEIGHMAKYVFLNMPAPGHVNPTLAVAQELVRRGQEVSYYLTEEFRDVVEATGAHFEPYESKLKDMPAMPSSFGSMGDWPTGRVVGPAFMLEDMQYVPSQVRDRIRAEQPAAIVYDFMCVWAKTVIDELQVPAIATRATYASNEHFNLMEHMRARMQNMPGARERMERMRAYMEAQGGGMPNPFASIFSAFSHAEQLNIIFMPREFQPAADTFDDRYLFVGPSILPRHEAPDFPFDRLSLEQPLLYISLGSIFTNQPEFYKQCFAAFADQNWQVVLSIGKQTDRSTLDPVPANFLLSAYVPQLEILPRTQLFVTHAGTNSVMESMYFGVPMVLIPQQPEQQLHAQRVMDMGLGVMLEKETVNATTLREAVEHVAHDPMYRERIQHMQQSVRTAGGYQRAADAIMEFTQIRVRS
jgi:MGT family glycosyltransferase